MAGLSFILPAVLVVILLTMFYVEYPSLPSVQNALAGMVPIMIGIITAAFIKLSKANVKDAKGFFILVISTLLLLGVNESVVLLMSDLLFSVVIRSMLYAVEPLSILMLFFVFLKIGSLFYGSSYVLISFFETELVEGLSWLSKAQLYDLVAIGEITSGPVFTTAIAVGWELQQFSLQGVKLFLKGYFKFFWSHIQFHVNPIIKVVFC